jgi:uncharacterized membrane protein
VIEEETDGGRFGTWEWILTLFLAAAAVLFVTAGMDRPIWADDANAVLMARHGLRSLLEALKHDNNFPAYYVLLSFWIRWFGDSEPAVRSLAALFYLASVGAVFAAAQRIFRDPRSALYAAVFYAGSVQAIWQAQSVRMYSMLGFLSAISLPLFWRLYSEETPSRRDYVMWAAINSIGALTHLWFCFVVVAQVVAWVTLRRCAFQRFLPWAAAPGVVLAVLWGPVFLIQLHNGSTHWLPPFRWWFAADFLWQFYGDPPLLGILVAAGIAVPLFLKASHADLFWREPRIQLLIAILLLSIAVPVALCAVRPIYYPSRYTIIVLPPLTVLIGAVLSRLAPARYAATLGVLVLLATGAWHIQRRGFPSMNSLLSAGQNDRKTAAYLVTHAVPGDAVVFTSLARTPADYYLARWGAADRFRETSFPADIDRHPGWEEPDAALRHPEALDAEACGLMNRLNGRVWLYYGFEPAVSDHLKRKLDASLKLEGVYDLRGPFHNQLLLYEPRVSK